MADAYLVLRAVVSDAADRPRFDEWYEAEHPSGAAVRFGARRGWRRWSRTDPAVHYASYKSADPERARAVLASPELRALVAKFDRAWGARGTRTCEILETAGAVELDPA